MSAEGTRWTCHVGDAYQDVTLSPAMIIFLPHIYTRALLSRSCMTYTRLTGCVCPVNFSQPYAAPSPQNCSLPIQLVEHASMRPATENMSSNLVYQGAS